MLESLLRRLYRKVENHKMAHYKKRRIFQRRYQELHYRRRKFYSKERELLLHQEFHHRHWEFNRYHKSLRFFRPISIIVNLIILYILFRWVGLKAISVLFAVFIIVKEVLQFIFLWRVEKRVFKPILKLKNGVEEIAKGNYDVFIETDRMHDLGFMALLVDSFNEMAQKLQAGEKLKSEYEENRKTLIANISHDLKTPITSVQGYIEAILDGVVNSPEKVTKYLKTIYQNIIYMDKLIDDLFIFSKLDLQKLEFKFEAIPIRAFMEDLMEEFKFELEERKINFYYRNKMEGDCQLNIDRKRVHQIFKNIIGNAVKFGSNPGFGINVQMNRRAEAVIIDIEDNGPGIPSDKLPYIFNRFYRIDNERTKDLMSTGLGLAIAKELVQAHGGSIEVSSAEGEGSCFSLKFPVITTMNEVGHETNSNY